MKNGAPGIERAWLRLPAGWWALLLLALTGLCAGAQSTEGGQDDSGQGAAESEGSTASSLALGAPVTVHGVVKNALTGEPLPRALVLVDGQSGIGALTDGDGRFEIPGVPLGPGGFQLTKPGFEDAAGAPGGAALRDLRGFSHVVFVTTQMADLVLAMRPTNAIRGQVELSTGDQAQNDGITLLRREVQNGREIWRHHRSARVNADGGFHFAHLDDGDYAVVAEPAPDSDLVGKPAADSNSDMAWNWYPELFYPDAHEFSGAARIHVAGGEEAQANLTLPLEPFHLVHASVIFPPELRNGGSGPGVDYEVLTADGRHLNYPAVYDGKSRSVQTMLPDGSYTLRVAVNGGGTPGGRSVGSGGIGRGASLTGQLDLTVAGHPLTTLRIPVGPVSPSPLQVVVSHAAAGGSTSGGSNRVDVFVEIMQAGALTDGMQSMYAQGQGPGSIETMAPSPGQYWVHTVVAKPGLCEGSFTAGGANLGREPLVVGPAGTTAPLTLTLRDDCASLKLSLPGSVAGMAAGEETGYTVYVVPDFDFTTEARSITLRASTGGMFTIGSLTPGSYHVYTFAAPVELEYHNREALAALPSQAITLTPGETADLVLEAPAQ